MPRHRPANGFYVRGRDDNSTFYFNQMRDCWGRFRSKHTRHPNKGSAENEIWRITHNDFNPDHLVIDIVRH